MAVPTEGATAGGPLPSPRSQQQPHSPKKRKATGSISQGDIQQEEKLKRNTGEVGWGAGGGEPLLLPLQGPPI